MAIPAPRDPEVTRERLAEWLTARVGTGVGVTDVEVPKQGFSNETVFFTATWSEVGRQRNEQLVARIQPDGHQLFLGTDVMLQWRMMEAVARAGTVPVPPLFLAEEDRAVLGAPFFIMRRVDGRVPVDLPSYHGKGWMVDDLNVDERARVWNNGLDAMAAIHQFDWRDGFEFLDVPARGSTGFDQYLHWVQEWYAWATRGRPQPTADVAMQHVLDHRPRDAEVTVVWGDSRLGNLMYADDLSVTAVMDWEMAALGPGEVDLGWWLYMDRLFADGFGLARLEGLPGRDATVSRYEAMRGRAVRDLEYYEIFAGLRMSIVLIRSTDQQVEYGILPPDTTMGTHNPATTVLADLLGLAPVEVSEGLTAATDGVTGGPVHA